MEDNTRKFMQYVSNVVNESKDKAVKEIFGDGYNEAAGICVGMITKKMDELYSQISSGSFLSEQEQFLLSNLKELKSETEEKLYDFWRDNGNEWQINLSPHALAEIYHKNVWCFRSARYFISYKADSNPQGESVLFCVYFTH